MTDNFNRRLAAILLAVIVIAAGLAGWWLAHRGAGAHYVTAPVTRGPVSTTITASGTVNPVITVQVGAYVSGTITELKCDFNTRVVKGQLCAKIDPSPYAVVVEQDEAELATARAQLAKDRANLAYASLANGRAQVLFSQDSGSRDAADAARNAHDQATAQVALDAAAVQQRTALLKAARINLNYTNIVSPVDGAVVSRNVNVGQTVASSFQTPTLFLIARDLTKMQVDTNVSESDIGDAREGAGASFTVEAYPDRTFHGRVSQVRQAPVSIQNVITYDVVVAADNPDLALKPGMTATVRIVTAQAQNALRVPSQSLRFAPAGVSRRGVSSAALPASATGRRRVWVVRQGALVAVPVQIGLDDGTFAEVTSGALRVGDRVAIGEEAPAKGGAASRPPARSPFRF